MFKRGNKKRPENFFRSVIRPVSYVHSNRVGKHKIRELWTDRKSRSRRRRRDKWRRSGA